MDAHRMERKENTDRRIGGKETEKEGNRRGCLNAYTSQRFIKSSCKSEKILYVLDLL